MNTDMYGVLEGLRRYRKEELADMLQNIVVECPPIPSRKREDLIKYIKKYIKPNRKIDDLDVSELSKIINDNENCIVLEKLSKADLFDLFMINYNKVYNKYKGKLPKQKPSTKGKDILKSLYGVTKYTEKEFQPKKFDVDCIVKDRTILELRPYQRNFIENFINSDYKGSICIAGMGLGKTLIAVVASRCYLDLYPNNKVIFIAPTSVIGNFISTMQKIKADLRDPRYEYYTYEEYLRKGKTCENSMMVLDEAHNFRTIIKKIESTNDDGSISTEVTKGKRVEQLFDKCASKAHKILLLTATPMINDVYDIEGLMSMIDQRPPISEKEFNNVIKDPKTIKDYFECKIGIIDLSDEEKKEIFPERRNKLVFIPFTEEFRKKYRELYTQLEKPEDDWVLREYGDKNLNAFHSGLRRLVNSGIDGKSPKVEWIIRNILKNNDIIPEHTLNGVKIPAMKQKYVIFTQFSDSGVSKIRQKLIDNNIKYAIIDGATSKIDRVRAKEDFNAGKIRVMIITKAGAEGVDLLECNNVILTEPTWNESIAEQAIARAIRTYSHHSLPKKLRYVNVYRLLMANTKADYDSDAINAIKEGTTNLLPFITGRLSIDLRIFLLSRIKQIRINNFINQLKKIQQVQNCVSKTTKDLNRQITQWQDKNKKVMGYRQKLTIKEKLLKENVKQVTTLIQENSEEVDVIANKIRKFVNKYKNYTIDKQLQIRNKIFNYFPTPFKVGRKLIAKSGIVDRFNDLKILEPSAGTGHLVHQILKVKPGARIDMVEYDPVNRDFLKELSSILPSLHLQKEPDFMKYETSERYDFVIMNPPFNVSSDPIGSIESRRTQRSKNYHDYDFIMKAYEFLDDGGRLCSIMRTDPLQRIYKGDVPDSLKPFAKFLDGVQWEQIDIPEKDWYGKEIDKDISIRVSMIIIDK